MSDVGRTPAKAAARAQAHIPKILLVDDEPRLLDSMQAIVASQGYKVQTANDGWAAVSLLKSGGFDVVLLDLGLPGLSGAQVMEHMAEQAIDTMVIVVTGEATATAAIHALRQGAYGFIKKPCPPAEIVNTLTNALAKRSLERDNKRMRLRLEQSERWYRYLVNHSPDVIFTLDREGRFTFLNDRVQSLLGYKPEELVGRHYSEAVLVEDLDQATFLFRDRGKDTRSHGCGELRLMRRCVGETPDGEARHVTVELNTMGIYENIAGGESQMFLGTYGVLKDVRERKKAEAIIRYQAYHDLLTGLPNRALFKDRLNLAIAQAKRNGHMLAIMFLDLDRFKVVNDTLGHFAGDELLRGVATRLRQCLRESDTLARLGGDEFIALLPQVASRADVVATADKVLDALGASFMIDGHEVFASSSIGIAVYPDDGATLDALIKNADIAMYQAKGSGRNNHQFYAAQMSDSLSDRLALESDMRRAIEADEFEVFYQPLINVASGEMVAAEALIRWRHPQRGILLPNEFIPLAEENGLVVALGEWTLHRVCAQLAQWTRDGLPAPAVAVNLSARQIEQPFFAQGFLRVLAQHRIETALINVEITESVIMKDVESTVSTLRELSLAGVSSHFISPAISHAIS
ncbi:MAG: diguanylate cyclase [Betaproteobacteria bacterium]|nr:diguanylate cyclase [Betaproteobacteria bacterium]